MFHIRTYDSFHNYVHFSLSLLLLTLLLPITFSQYNVLRFYTHSLNLFFALGFTIIVASIFVMVQFSDAIDTYSTFSRLGSISVTAFALALLNHRLKKEIILRRSLTSILREFFMILRENMCFFLAQAHYCSDLFACSDRY
jgi:hypothetical protein